MLVSQDELASRGARAQRSFVRRHRRKLLALVLWFLLGSSVSMDTETGTMGLRPWTLTASAVLFAVSIATSRHLNRQEAEKEDDGPQTDPS